MAPAQPSERPGSPSVHGATVAGYYIMWSCMKSAGMKSSRHGVHLQFGLGTCGQQATPSGQQGIMWTSGVVSSSNKPYLALARW